MTCSHHGPRAPVAGWYRLWVALGARGGGGAMLYVAPEAADPFFYVFAKPQVGRLKLWCHFLLDIFDPV